MKLKNFIFQDWYANKGNIKGRIIVLMFRLATLVSRNKITKILFIPFLIFYRIFVEWFLGIEVPFGTKIGSGFTIYHGQALVINKNSIIGKNCTIRQSTTIGNKKKGSPAPVIGDFVDIGSNVCIIGDITIGNNSVIGAGSIVTRDIPANSVVVGNPGRVIKTLNL